MLLIKFNPADLDTLYQKIDLIKLITQDADTLENIGLALVAQAKTNIDEGSPNGKASYAILKPKTIAQKVKYGYSQKPLQRTGDLLASIAHEVDGSKLYMTALDYAKYHQYGTKKMPPRPIFTIRPKTEENIKNILQNRIKQIFNT